MRGSFIVIRLIVVTVWVERFNSWSLPPLHSPSFQCIPRCVGRRLALEVPFASRLVRPPPASGQSSAVRGRWATWHSWDAYPRLPNRTLQIQVLERCTEVYEAQSRPSQAIKVGFCANAEFDQSPGWRKRNQRTLIRSSPCEPPSGRWIDLCPEASFLVAGQRGQCRRSQSACESMLALQSLHWRDCLHLVTR